MLPFASQVVLYAPRCHPWHHAHDHTAEAAPCGWRRIARSARAAAKDVLTLDAAEHFEPAPSTAVDDAHSPWSVAWQMREQNILWGDELKLRVVKRLAAQDLGIDDEELEGRLHSLCILLPDFASRLLKGPPEQIARLGLSTHLIAQRLLRLREVLPKADISQLVASRLSLLLEEDLDVVEAAVARLRVLLPHLSVDKFVEVHPQVLDVQDFEHALEDAKLMMPQSDMKQVLRNSPELILGLQKGRHLIPYELPNE